MTQPAAESAERTRHPFKPRRGCITAVQTALGAQLLAHPDIDPNPPEHLDAATAHDAAYAACANEQQQHDTELAAMEALEVAQLAAAVMTKTAK